MLSKLESAATQPITDIIDYKNVPEMLSRAHIRILYFMTALLGRTKDAAEHLNEMGDKLFKAMYKYDDRFKGHLDKVRLKMKNAPAVMLGYTMRSSKLMGDMAFKILINETKKPFIISDNPVVLYNQFLEKRNKIGSNIGFICKGLQIFMPVSPDICLIFYDDNVYNAGSLNKREIIVKEEEDINRINGLQLCKAENHLYFNESIDESYINMLKNTYSKYRKSAKSTLKQFMPNVQNPERPAGLLMVYREDIRIGLKLSFISETEHAKNYVMGLQIFHPRSELLLELAEKIHGRERKENNSKIFINPDTGMYKEIKFPNVGSM
jgi:hypothetical protein